MTDDQLHLSNQVCFPIYSASRLITKTYKPFLDQMGITYPQYLVLMVLWENDKLTVNQISEKLLLNTNTISPLLKRMEKLDLLERNRCNNDERSVIVQLKEKGVQMKETAKLIPDQLLEILSSDNIDLEEIVKLKEMLNQWIDILTQNNKKQ